MTGGGVHAAGKLQLQLVQGEHLLHEAQGGCVWVAIVDTLFIGMNR